jgi:outer membrane receptor protein involved in Fe transport
VWEFAGEVNIPVMKGVPLIQNLTADIAGRYTDYSVSGAVQTWKIGLDWHIDDTLRFRATNSVDIRAPTLNDLFSPLQLTPQSFTDLHTGNLNGNVPLAVHGNPNLVPEVARTYTAGMVLTPTLFRGFTFSMDYYRIVLKNAITAVSSSSTAVQQLCEYSGGTSPFCDLYVRPFPFSDRSPANYPTLVYNQSLNAAVNRLEGWDIETDYRFDMAEVLESLPGSVNARLLVNIQPVNQQVQFPGAPLTFTATAKGHATAFLSYNLNSWTFNFEDRWISGFPKAQAFGQIYAIPRVDSINYLDLSVDKAFHLEGTSVDAYLSVQNITNARPPLNPANSTNPGLFFMSARPPNLTAYDAVGRYFTIGVRATL